jgi:hypothetical protein
MQAASIKVDNIKTRLFTEFLTGFVITNGLFLSVNRYYMKDGRKQTRKISTYIFGFMKMSDFFLGRDHSVVLPAF